MCSPDDTCFCDEDWTGDDCSEQKNVTTEAPSLLPVSPGSPTPLVKVGPLPIGEEEERPVGTTPTMQDLEAAPVAGSVVCVYLLL